MPNGETRASQIGGGEEGHGFKETRGGAPLRRAWGWLETRFSLLTVILVTCGLLLAHIAVLSLWNGQMLGSFLSDLIQTLFGVLCILTSLQAFRHSSGAGRYYWGLMAASFAIYVLPQGFQTYADAFAVGKYNPLIDFMFIWWLLPLGMMLFLDPDYDPKRSDRLHLLDFLQVCIFWGSTYLVFSPGQSMYIAMTGWKWWGWTPSVVIDGVLATSFLLRAMLTNSGVVRRFFGQTILFIFLAGVADSYSSFTPNQVSRSGTWIDFAWSVITAIPVLMAATWHQEECPPDVPLSRVHSIVVRQFFPLLFPFFSILLLTQVARTHTNLAFLLIILSFAGVGARVLIIQHRLVHAQAALEFEAAHDTLTGLWNRPAILGFLDQEVVRHRRSAEPLGVMMIDVDHFKIINDTRGHLVGDMVLRELANRLMASTRSYNFVGRYGGEEFLIVNQNCDGPGILCCAERLRQEVAEAPLGPAHDPIHVTVSVGVVSATSSILGLDRSMLVHAADCALYRAKDEGRNCVRSANSIAEPETVAVKPSENEAKGLSTRSSG